MSLLVHGKGDKDSMVPLSDELTRELSALPYGYFFPYRHQGHICPDTAYALVEKRTGWPPHSFRRRFGTDVWKATGGRGQSAILSLVMHRWPRRRHISMTQLMI